MKTRVKAALVAISLMVGVTACGGSGGSSGIVCSSYFATAVCASVWSQLSPTGTTPSARLGMGTAYDESNDTLISFGGTNDVDYYNDVYVLDQASGLGSAVWSQLSPAGGPPSGRAFVATGYHSASNELIVFGGTNVSSIYMDLWILSNANGTGGAPTWTSPAVGGSAPSPRVMMASAYDEAGDTLILFGGRACGASSCTLYNDVYLITDVTTAPTWQQLSPTGTAPAARIAASGVYDPTDNRLIVYGGTTSTSPTTVASSAQSDTWVLTNANGIGGTPAWIKLAVSGSPERRYAHRAVYDASTDRMMVFGGVDSSNAALDDVSILSDSRGTSPTWAVYAMCDTTPSSRRFTSMSYATSDNRVIVFAGEGSDGTVFDDIWVLANANGNPPTGVEAVSVDVDATELCDGYFLQLIPHAYDASGDEVYDFLYQCAVDDTSVATVNDDCRVEGVSPGSVRVTVTINGITEEILLTIVSPDSGGGGGDTGNEETWTGTYEIVDVFDGVWVCTYTTKGNITMSITNTDGKLSGSSAFEVTEDTVVSDDPYLSCPPQVHLSEGTLSGEVLGSGDYSFSFFDLDFTNVAPFTADISGDSFTASGTASNSMDEYTFSIQATRK